MVLHLQEYKVSIIIELYRYRYELGILDITVLVEIFFFKYPEKVLKVSNDTTLRELKVLLGKGLIKKQGTSKSTLYY